MIKLNQKSGLWIKFMNGMIYLRSSAKILCDLGLFNVKKDVDFKRKMETTGEYDDSYPT